MSGERAATDDRILSEIERAAVLERECLAQACDADLPWEARERAETNHRLAGETGQELRTILARRTLLLP